MSRRKPLSAPSPPLSPLPPPTRDPHGAWRLALPTLLLLYLGFAIAHALMVPIGYTGYQNAPDEAAHMRYVRDVAHWRLPTQQTATAPDDYEWHQPPLYYLLAARLLPLGPHAVRFASILCGVACILLIYRAARTLFPNDPVLAVLAAGIAALTPTHVAITSTVNNDALLEVCFSGALLVLIGAFHGGLTLWRAGWLGVAIGAAILTKATGLLLIPLALVAFLLLRRNGDRPSDLLRGAVWMAAMSVAICGWWLVRNVNLYGQPLPLRAFEQSFAGTVTAQKVISGQVPIPGVEGAASYYALVAKWTFQSFWAVYGTPRSAVIGAPRFLPETVYLLLGLISLVSFAGLVVLHFQRKSKFTEMQIRVIRLLFVAVGLVALSFVAFVVKYFQTQGRYLYPAMLAICILLAMGWRAVFPSRYANLASVFLLAMLATISLVFLLAIAP